MDEKNLRGEVLAQILEKTNGAFFISAADAGRLIDGRCCHTTYRQILGGRFPLRTIKFGRNVVVRVHELADFLVTGEVKQSPASTVATPAKRGPGRPRRIRPGVM